MDAKSFHISVQGASHIKKNKECQDASASYSDDTLSLAIVCDGHGGDDYVRSAIGARFAADITEKNIRSFCERVDKDDLRHHSERLITMLESSIISDWNEAVNAHYAENPFTEAELSVLSEKAKRKYLNKERIESAYGTTVIAVVVTPDFWFGIHIGDGKCVAVSPEGRFVQPIPWDDKCFLNATTSICDSEALNNFRHFYSEKLPVAVFVGSDGIDDCFNNSQQLNNLYKTILYSFATNEFESAVSELHDYLPRLSAKGSGDDVSIAAVLDLDKIGEIEAVKEFDREKEKARVEENARKAAEKAEEERLRVEREHSSAVQATATQEVQTCKKCGAELRPGMKYCSECGEKVIAVDEQSTAMISTPETVQILKVVPFGNDTPHNTELEQAVETEEEASSEEKDNAMVQGSEAQGFEQVDEDLNPNEVAQAQEVFQAEGEPISCPELEVRSEALDSEHNANDDSVAEPVLSQTDMELEHQTDNYEDTQAE